MSTSRSVSRQPWPAAWRLTLARWLALVQPAARATVATTLPTAGPHTGPVADVPWHPAQRLDVALAALVYRSTCELEAAGHRVAWRIFDGAGALCPTPAVLQGLSDAVRSGVTEVLRQARRDEPVRLRIERLDGETGQHLRLVIQCTGAPPVSFDAAGAATSEACGLLRLQRCATGMGAQLDLVDTERHWRAELVLPLAPPQSLGQSLGNSLLQPTLPPQP
ncbi:MAG: hypothetical protein AB9M60_15140 [Leptothrix sp. (in: b-proteobacteria)]